MDRSLSLGSKKNYKKLCCYAKKGMRFTALSKDMMSDIKAKFMTDSVFYLPNAIDLNLIRGSRCDREAFLKQNGLPADAFIVGHVGRFHPVKNHEKLFGVFRKVHEKCPEARLILIGTGASQEIERIQALMEKYGVSDVALMMGMRPDATAIMSVFDAFVLTSLSESFSLVLVEAQAQGVRCITSSVVPSEVICENCLALDLDEADEIWAEAVLSKQFYPSNNRIEQYDIESVITELTEMYVKALADK